MSIGGQDPGHDLPEEDKDLLEADLRAQARELRRIGKPKEANQKNSQAIEISRRKSKRAHQGMD